MKESILHNISRKINRLFFKKDLIIIFGKYNNYILAVNDKKIIDYSYINDLDLKSFRLILAKYYEYQISVIIDLPELEFTQDKVMLSSNLLSSNKVNYLLNQSLGDNDFWTHQLFEKKDKNSPSKFINFHCLLPENALELIEYIIQNSKINCGRFNGCYFLGAQMPYIIDQILEYQEIIEYNDCLQAFVTLLESSEISVFIKHKDKLLKQYNMPFPKDKTDEYMQGTLQQFVSDKLLSMKNYVAHHNLEVVIIFATNENLSHLLIDSKFKDCHKVIIPLNKIDFAEEVNHEYRFFDPLLCKYFVKEKKYPAYNQVLNKISRLNLLHNFFAKPTYFIAGIILTILVLIKIYTIVLDKQTDSLSWLYHEYKNDYDNFKNLYKLDVDPEKLAELYKHDKDLKDIVDAPFEDIQSLYNYLHKNDYNINKFTWQVVDGSYLKSNRNLSLMNINLAYRVSVQHPQKIYEKIKVLTEDLRKLLSNYNIKIELNQDNLLIENNLTISFNLTIYKNL